MIISECLNCGRTFPLVEINTCYQCHKKFSLSYKRDLKIKQILKSKKRFWQFWKN
jgi:Zn finger protein HypA/HybF involved in hydrogenase expression